jgi:hypothetical protein
MDLSDTFIQADGTLVHFTLLLRTWNLQGALLINYLLQIVDRFDFIYDRELTSDRESMWQHHPFFSWIHDNITDSRIGILPLIQRTFVIDVWKHHGRPDRNTINSIRSHPQYCNLKILSPFTTRQHLLYKWLVYCYYVFMYLGVNHRLSISCFEASAEIQIDHEHTCIQCCGFEVCIDRSASELSSCSCPLPPAAATASKDVCRVAEIAAGTNRATKKEAPYPVRSGAHELQPKPLASRSQCLRRSFSGSSLSTAACEVCCWWGIGADHRILPCARES